MKDFFLVIKCIFIGNSGVGKTSIIERYIKDNFNCSTTIGVEFYSKKLLINDILFKLHIWDLAGQMTFRNIIQNYYRNTAIVFYVFDKNNLKSLNDIDEWLETITELESKLVILIGNKCDLNGNKILDSVILEKIAKYNLIYFETSAKDSININKVFEDTLKIYFDKLLIKEPNLYQKKIAEKFNYPDGIKFSQDIDEINIAPKKCCN